MPKFQNGQTVYIITNLQIAIIHSYLGSDNYNIQYNSIIQQINETQITDDKDFIIKLLIIKNKHLQEDYQDFRDAWWRLKEQNNYYLKIINKNKYII